VIAEVAQLEPENTRLNPRSDRYIEGSEPFAKRIPAVTGQVLSNGQHESTSLKLSYSIIIAKSEFERRLASPVREGHARA
jgi:hypothetical protein